MRAMLPDLGESSRTGLGLPPSMLESAPLTRP